MAAPADTPTWRQGALQAIFALFLGLILAAFVGVSVYSAFPPPDSQNEDAIQQLYREQEALYRCDPEADECTPTAAEQTRIEAIDAEVRQLQEQDQQRQEDWAQSTSIVLIVVATVLLAIAIGLARVERAWAISSGVLLGGLFTMLYGVGWSLAGGEGLTRVWVLLVAVLITLGLGYLRFVRLRPAHEELPTPALSGAVSGASASGADSDEALARIAALEARLDAVGRVFAPRD